MRKAWAAADPEQVQWGSCTPVLDCTIPQEPLGTFFKPLKEVKILLSSSSPPPLPASVAFPTALGRERTELFLSTPARLHVGWAQLGTGKAAVGMDRGEPQMTPALAQLSSGGFLASETVGKATMAGGEGEVKGRRGGIKSPALGTWKKSLEASSRGCSHTHFPHPNLGNPGSAPGPKYNGDLYITCFKMSEICSSFFWFESSSLTSE